MTTQNHITEMEAQGFTVFERAMSPNQLATAQNEVNRLMSHSPLQEGAYQCTNLTNGHEVFRELASHAALLEVVDAILGADCILSGVNMRCVTPGCAPQGLHRDTEIWGPSLFWMEKPVGINVGWAFDDFTEENGATRVVPGSHRRPDASSNEPKTALVAPAGSLIAFDARLIHGAGENRSQSIRRAGFTFYLRHWLKPQTDHKRSTNPALVETLSPTLVRLLGFQRQTPVQSSDGQAVIIPAPGATSFYG